MNVLVNSIIFAVLLLILLSGLLRWPWDLLSRIIILRVPLLILAIAWFVYGNEQIREILAVTDLRDIHPLEKLVSTIPVVILLLLATALWFWSSVFCSLYNRKNPGDALSRIWPTVIPALLLTIVYFNWRVATGAASDTESIASAFAFFGIVWGSSLVADLFFRNDHSEKYLDVTKEYLLAAFKYLFCLLSLGWGVGFFRTAVAFVGLAIIVTLLPFLIFVIAIDAAGRWTRRIEKWVTDKVVRFTEIKSEQAASHSKSDNDFAGPSLRFAWIKRRIVELYQNSECASPLFWFVCIERRIAEWYEKAPDFGQRLIERLIQSYQPISTFLPERTSIPTKPSQRIHAPAFAEFQGEAQRTELRTPKITSEHSPSDPQAILISILTGGGAVGYIYFFVVPIWSPVLQSYPFQMWLIALAKIVGVLAFAWLWTIIAGLALPSLAFLAFFALPLFDAQALASFFGTIGIANIFLLACLALFCLLAVLGAAIERPLIALFLLSILLLSVFDLNDNHAIRSLDHVTPSGAAVTQGRKSTSLAEAFDAWLAARRDRARFSGQGGYPVYIVAARGGGMYAAQHAARFLARTQDRLSLGEGRYGRNKASDFAHHVFAVSAVSGGSLGAAMFSALVNEQQRLLQTQTLYEQSPPDGWFEKQAGQFLDQDFLSPVTAAALFQDTVSQLIPCVHVACPTRSLDRSRAFERSLEIAWDRQFGAEHNPFAQDFTSQWNPLGDAPALLLNTTEVETGDRVVVSPFRLTSAELPSLVSLLERAPDLQISLSTAAGLSARFPGLTSAGWYEATASNGLVKRRLVDGGYFDNSGIATALDVISVIRRHHPEVTPILIALTGSKNSEPMSPPSYGFGEILSPFRTLETTRQARSDLMLEQAYVALEGKPCRNLDSTLDVPCAYEGNARVSMLSAADHTLPLGWFLSSGSRDEIASSVGEPSDCKTAVSASEHDTARKQLADYLSRRNGCLVRKIGEELFQR
jgi:hypothetical protein